MIDQSTIQKVLDATDIVDVVKEFVTLHKAGVNYKGLCPFHNEKTPSFVVSPAKQICKCYGCGKGGNALHFLMEMEQLTYPEAIKWLGKKYGIEIREKEMTDKDRQAQTERESLFIINEWARNYFENNLHESADGLAIGLAYFRQRGLRDDIIRKFHLGYSLVDKDSLYQAAISKGFNSELLIKTGLCFKTDDGKVLDRYHGRVIYPVHSISGKVVAFGGRILTQNKNVGKYVNSPESEIYSKSHELYGLYEAKRAIVQENSCFLVEGYMDVISMHQSGVENVVASSGTSLTEGQIRLLHRFTNNITVLYDGDNAGIHASLRGIDMLLSEGLNIKVLLLPEGEDPDSFAQKYGASKFQGYIKENQVDFIRFKTDLLMKDVGNDPIKRANFISDIIHSISLIPEGIIRQMYSRECAQMIHVSEEMILSEVAKMRRETTTQVQEKDERQRERELQEQEKQRKEDLQIQSRNKVAQMERLLIRDIIRHGEQPLFESEGVQYRVISYICEDLKNDSLKMQNQLYQHILSEAELHVSEKNWHSLPFFLNNPEESISMLAAELSTDKNELCTNNRIQYGEDTDHLADRIPQLLNDYKMALIEAELETAHKELAEIYKSGDLPKVLEYMKKIKELDELHKAIGEATQRIITLK